MGRATAAAMAVLAATVVLCPALARAEKKTAPKAAAQTEPQPVLRIPVAPLGYLPPGAFYTTYRRSSAALGFFDDDRLIFAFPVNTLMQRTPGDDSSDDHEIRAVALDARTGQVLQQTDWRMTDYERYLWPFTEGRFLLRLGDSLYVLDSSLKLEPWMRAPAPIREVQVSPQRRWMLVEFDNPAGAHIGPTLGDSATEETPVKLAFLPVGSRTVKAMSELPDPGMLPLMDGGLLGVKEGKQAGSWVLNETPLGGDPQFVGSVSSFCHPKVQPLSESVALVAWCPQDGYGQPVFAVNLAGKQLWQDMWQSKYVWPYFDYAADGSRFVYESVEINVPMSIVGDTLDQDEIVRQLAGVYDTESGKLVMVKDANPVVTAGQNVALSADGSRFAILRDGAIEIYDLPAASPPAPASPAKKRQAGSGLTSHPRG